MPFERQCISLQGSKEHFLQSKEADFPLRAVCVIGLRAVTPQDGSEGKTSGLVFLQGITRGKVGYLGSLYGDYRAGDPARRAMCHAGWHPRSLVLLPT